MTERGSEAARHNQFCNRKPGLQRVAGKINFPFNSVVVVP